MLQMMTKCGEILAMNLCVCMCVLHDLRGRRGGTKVHLASNDNGHGYITFDKQHCYLAREIVQYSTPNKWILLQRSGSGRPRKICKEIQPAGAHTVSDRSNKHLS